MMLGNVEWMQIVGLASSVDEACSLAKVGRPTSVLTDYWLPDGTGADVCRKVRQLESAVSVVVLTADADAASRGMAGSGLTSILSKPSSRQALLVELQRAALETPLVPMYGLTPEHD
jgi:CheY-like chemotaxis protein